MKLLCIDGHYNRETKRCEFVFVSDPGGDVWITGELRVSSEKPTHFTLGETYDAKEVLG